MTLDDVRQLDATLQTRGEALSANKLTAHLGGSKRDALRLLREYRAETHKPPTTPAAPVAVLEPAMVPEDADPVSTAPEAGRPTLLVQAEARLRAALAEEHRVRRGIQQPGQPITWACLERCQQATRQAQAQMDRLTRSQASLIAGIPSARIEARRAAGELVVLEEETRRRLIRARRSAQQAQQALDQMEADLLAIAGVTVLAEAST